MTTRSLSVFLLASSLGLPAHAAAAEEVPFKGRLEAVFSVTPLDPLQIFVQVQCTQCEATHLGKFTLIMPHTVQLVPPADPTLPPTATARGNIVLTAANGDTVTANFVGQAFLPSPVIADIVEIAVITGGTGRFAGATGSLRLQRTANLATLETTGSIEGTISAPGTKN